MNDTGTLVCVPCTSTYGIPIGAPLYTVPKSGCNAALAPQFAINVAEFGSTGSAETSRFHGLSAGKIERPAEGNVLSLTGPVAALIEWLASPQAMITPAPNVTVRLMFQRIDVLHAKFLG